MKKPLTPFQEKFCLFYHATNNATQSYKDAYGTDKDTTAKKNSHELLKRSYIQERLKELQADIQKQYKVTTEKIIQENAKLAFIDINDHFEMDDDMNLRAKPDIDLNALDGVSFSSSRSSSKDGDSESKSWSIKLPQKIKALQELARLTGAYQDIGDNKDDKKAAAEKLLEALSRFKKKE